MARSSARFGIIHNHLEHEAVNLGFGQRVGAFLFEGVLRGHHQERLRQPVGVVAEGDLAFLHGFEQGALDLGRGAVDFVGQDEVAEDRAVLGVEAAVARVVDHGADDVGGQHVGRELEAVELQLRGGGQRLERERLGQARHAFEEDVAVGDQADEQAVHEVLSGPRARGRFPAAAGATQAEVWRTASLMAWMRSLWPPGRPLRRGRGAAPAEVGARPALPAGAGVCRGSGRLPVRLR